MKQFLKRLLYFALIGIIPAILLVILYFYFDPFKVLRTYNDYSNPFVVPNREYISTTLFIKNYNEYKYDSFIFGSSRTVAFKPKSWRKYLSENSMPFKFDASGESIYGIYKKVRFLDSLNVKLKNVLIIVCTDVSFTTSMYNQGLLFIKHPAISGESKLNFQLTFLKAYFNPKFLFSFYAYKIIGEYKPFMHGCIENRKMAIDMITNELTIVDQETEISQNPSEYYLKRKSSFYERHGEHRDSIQRINDKQLFMLHELNRIFDKNGTNYKVIIGPLYDQVKFSCNDMDILKTVFGDNLYDFSGKNKFTESITNYYEPSHYRPLVGDSILHFIYKKQTCCKF